LNKVSRSEAIEAIYFTSNILKIEGIFRTVIVFYNAGVVRINLNEKTHVIFIINHAIIYAD